MSIIQSISPTLTSPAHALYWLKPLRGCYDLADAESKQQQMEAEAKRAAQEVEEAKAKARLAEEKAALLEQ